MLPVPTCTRMKGRLSGRPRGRISRMLLGPLWVGWVHQAIGHHCCSCWSSRTSFAQYVGKLSPKETFYLWKLRPNSLVWKAFSSQGRRPPEELVSGGELVSDWTLGRAPSRTNCHQCMVGNSAGACPPLLGSSQLLTPLSVWSSLTLHLQPSLTSASLYVQLSVDRLSPGDGEQDYNFLVS